MGLLLRCMASGKVLGYGLFRRAVDHATIVAQPLYGNSASIVEVLLYNALSSLMGVDKVVMEVWNINQEAMDLARDKLGLSQVRTSTAMFTDRDVAANFGHIFASSPTVFYPF